MPDDNTIYRVCSYLRNWFDKNQQNYSGRIEIVNGALAGTYNINAGQYFRIVGSHANNDGVYKFPVTVLNDEVFDGAIVGMSIPLPVLRIMDKIEAWESKYANVSSASMSPFSSESISGVYSYSKSTGANDTTKDKSGTWQGTFGAELAPWRKM